MKLIAGFVLTIICATGCARRDGMNFDCSWPPDQEFGINLKDGSHMRHLLDDIRIAEELEVRYGDQLGGSQLVSVLGVQVRTGAGGARTPTDVRDECREMLFATIAKTHDLELGEVLAARGHLSDRGADLPVNIPNAILYAFIANRVIQRVRRRFEPDQKWSFWIAIVPVSLVVSVLFVLIGSLWAGMVEIVRVGNEHLSYRAGRISWSQYPFEVFVVGVGTFWLLALANRYTHKLTPDVFPPKRNIFGMNSN